MDTAGDFVWVQQAGHADPRLQQRSLSVAKNGRAADSDAASWAVRVLVSHRRSSRVLETLVSRTQYVPTGIYSEDFYSTLCVHKQTSTRTPTPTRCLVIRVYALCSVTTTLRYWYCRSNAEADVNPSFWSCFSLELLS